nr:Coronin-7 [Polyrhizophydium stewartii]
MKRFQNLSKYRHSVVSAGKREALGLVPVSAAGRLDSVQQLHVGPCVTDLDWAPWRGSDGAQTLAVGADDGTVRLWSVTAAQAAAGGEAPAVLAALPAEPRRIEALLFHPTASGVLALASASDIRIWDVAAQSPAFGLDGGDVVQSFAWKTDGALLASIAKDNKLRIYDARAGKAWSAEAHNGVKPSRLVWAGSSDMLFTTGFNARRDREYSVWDERSLAQPLVTTKIDTSPGILTPLYDADTSMLFIAGKGDTSIRWVEIKTDNPAAPVDSAGMPFTGTTTFAGACLVPKLGLDIMGCEVARVLGVTSDGSAIVPVSAVVPRKTHADFHADIFPDTTGEVAPMHAAEWIAGGNKLPDKVSLDPAKRGSAVPAATPASGPASRSAQAPAAVPLKPAALASAAASAVAAPPAAVAPAAKAAPPAVPAKPAVKLNLPKHSAYRFIAGKTASEYEDLKGLSVNLANETDAFQANTKFLAFSMAGPGGRVGVWPVERKERFPALVPCIVNGSDLHDFKLDPFNPARIATGCEDGRVRLFTVPDGGLAADAQIAPDAAFLAHNGRVAIIAFHPTAADVLLTYSPEQGGAGGPVPTVKIWNLVARAAVASFTVSDQVLGVAFSPRGDRVACVVRDKTVQVFDARSGKLLQRGPAHEGVKAARVLGSQREVNVYDASDLSKPLNSTSLDTTPGMLIPYFDPDTSLLVLAGRGESTMAFYEMPADAAAAPLLLTRYSVPGGSQQTALAFLPKRYCRVREIEVLCAVRLAASAIERISFTVPRLQKDFFQDDIFVPTVDVETPAVSAEDWAKGVDGEVKRIDLRPADMVPRMSQVSQAPQEKKPEPRMAATLAREQSEDERKEATMRAMFQLAIEESAKGPLPQDLVEGVADDEWD